jgi:phosphoribosyl 1,2-cyclic phosphodiesterase
MFKKNKSDCWIKFLGTAGARFVMLKQLRASGGLWIHSGETSVLIDPGPGSLVRCAASRPRLDPTVLDAVILTHRHLDHANDVNVMVEAMTEGGYKKRGVVFLPQDAIEDDAILLRHTRNYAAKVEILKENGSYGVGGFSFSTTSRFKHPCQTYGLKFTLDGVRVCLVSDTEYFEGLKGECESDLLIVNVVLFEPRPGIQHLNFNDVKNLAAALKPKKTILTHFGMSMLKAQPHLLAKTLAWETGLNIEAASDGMVVDLKNFSGN